MLTEENEIVQYRVKLYYTSNGKKKFKNHYIVASSLLEAQIEADEVAYELGYEDYEVVRDYE